LPVPHDVDDDVRRVAGGELDIGYSDAGSGACDRSGCDETGADERDTCDDGRATPKLHAVTYLKAT
jgi:hypothetical protein